MQSHYITASRHCITPPHYTTASHHRITSLHYTIALRHCITPLRHNTRSTRSTAYTLGRHCKPISSHNRAARHPRATLQPQSVPQQFCAAPLGNALPLFRRWRVRIDPVSNKPGDTFGTAHTLGRRYKPISFHNRAMRHSRATLLPLNVPQQFCATPSGNTLPLFRRWRVRIEAVLNKPGDSFSTLGRRFKPTSFHNRAARHFRATYSPKVFPNSAMRHSRATLCHFFVAETYALIPS